MESIQETKNNFRHFFMVPFTGLGLYNGYRGDKWLKNRINIFNEYVLPSLINQTKKEFIVWICWRLEERQNEIVKEFMRMLEDIRGMRFVHTFGGIPFYDDKYDEDKANYRLYRNLEATLPELKDYVGDAEVVFMTIQPSDDMYFSRMAETIQCAWPEDKDAMGFQRGYIMNYATKELAEYNPTTTPPFATIRFRAETFLDPRQHFQFTGPYKSHEFVKDHLREGFWEDRGFVVGTHGVNISTVWKHHYKGREITGGERDYILWMTNSFFARPIAVKRTLGLVARSILNALPFQNKLREIYHRLPSRYKIF